MIDRITVLAADADSTLTGREEPLPSPVKEAFEILHRNSVKMGLAAARPVTESMKRTGTSWGLSFDFDFMIGMNGGMLYDRSDDSLWTADRMTREEIRDILMWMMPLISRYRIPVTAEDGTGSAAYTGDPEDFCGRPAVRLVFRYEPDCEKEVRERFLSRFGRNYRMSCSFPGTLEVMRRGCDRGSAIRKYADKHGIGRNGIIGFGSGENDIALLVVCGWGVALKGSDPGTISIADDSTDYTCAEGGAGRYLLDRYIVPKGLK